MHFILDIGNVLIDFKPEKFLRSLLNDPPGEDRMNRLIFQGPEWVKLDEGRITQEEALAIFLAKEPLHQELTKKVMDNLTGLLTPIPETIALLPRVKMAGHGLYFLSNYHDKLRHYILARYPFFSLFDGGVFSCDVHITKPAAGIYTCLLDQYRLKPEDCLFFDDMAPNTAAAERLGMRAVLFSGAGDIERFL
ncbi:MAG: HAD family phosphatase [Oscillospiraceae bacterium]|nr:HAD family phosphatase [Oscillospiraceae bacterium]